VAGRSNEPVVTRIVFVDGRWPDKASFIVAVWDVARYVRAAPVPLPHSKLTLLYKLLSVIVVALVPDRVLPLELQRPAHPTPYGVACATAVHRFPDFPKKVLSRLGNRRPIIPPSHPFDSWIIGATNHKELVGLPRLASERSTP